MSEHGDLHLAIIGAGIAGSAAADIASNQFNNATIDVFEKQSRVGGRIAASTFGPYTVEAGALGGWDRYHYLTDYIDRLDLERTKPFAFDGMSHTVNKQGPFLGVWNGDGFSTTISKSLPGMVSFLAEHGVSPFKLWWRSKQIATAFESLHELIENGDPYTSPSELLTDLGIADIIHQSAREYFLDNGVSNDCIETILNPLLRTIWGHDAGMQTFVAAVTVEGMIAHENLQSVRGGNVLFVERLLEAVDATVRTETTITTVTAENGTYRLSTTTDDFGPYDAVVIAIPLDNSSIVFDNMTLPHTLTRDREYQSRHIGLVKGRLNPAYFGFKERSELPTMIATTADVQGSFTSTVIAREVEKEQNIYRVNANNELNNSLLEEMFSAIEKVEQYSWDAFPIYNPPMSHPPFRIKNGLYYANAMESSISTMETQIMSSRNIIDLLSEDIQS
jgi:phytoene dehydrogenase-like protein